MDCERDNPRCFYLVLGINKGCSADDIRAAYKRLAMKWHPDKCGKDLEVAKHAFQAIQEAYSVLSDDIKRSRYDLGILESDEEDDTGQDVTELDGLIAELTVMMDDMMDMKCKNFAMPFAACSSSEACTELESQAQDILLSSFLSAHDSPSNSVSCSSPAKSWDVKNELMQSFMEVHVEKDAIGKLTCILDGVSLCTLSLMRQHFDNVHVEDAEDWLTDMQQESLDHLSDLMQSMMVGPSPHCSFLPKQSQGGSGTCDQGSWSGDVCRKDGSAIVNNASTNLSTKQEHHNQHAGIAHAAHAADSVDGLSCPSVLRDGNREGHASSQVVTTATPEPERNGCVHSEQGPALSGCTEARFCMGMVSDAHKEARQVRGKKGRHSPKKVVPASPPAATTNKPSSMTASSGACLAAV